MVKVIGVRFRTAGKVYFFDPLAYEIKRGDHVIVETARGIEFGTVISSPYEVEDDKVIQPLKPVLRLATEKDIEQEASNKIKEKEAYRVCLEKIRKHELDMKLIDAEYTFDNNKVLFYFTADGRIDFRELVKDLAGVFKTRIELRQIGVRDETKIVGGIGICGRPLCCHSYLSDFVPVSIKMAKEQNLSLNPTKISGVCGRLMCCLKNEEETYEELNRKLPNIGDYVTTEDGLKGEVHSVNVLRQLVKVVVDVDDEKEIREYEVDKLHFKRKHGKKERMDLSKEELQELERLEKEEEQESGEKQYNKNDRNRGGNRENRDGDRGNRENRDGDRGNRENRDGDRGNRENRDGDRGNRENRDGDRGNRENRDGDRGNRENRGNRDGERGNRENKEVNQAEGTSEAKENRGEQGEQQQGRNRKERYGNKNRNRDNREQQGGSESNGEEHREGGAERNGDRGNRNRHHDNRRHDRNRQNKQNREGQANSGEHRTESE